MNRTIRILTKEELQPENLVRILAEQAKRTYEYAEARRAQAAMVEQQRPSPVLPLVEQIRQLIATWPPSMTQRLRIEQLLPHLNGKYRDRPNHVGIAKALRQLGYVSVRSYKAADGSNGRRFWTKVINHG